VHARLGVVASLAGVGFVAAALLDEGSLAVYVLLALTACVTVGISLLMGHGGQVSLGQGAF